MGSEIVDMYRLMGKTAGEKLSEEQRRQEVLDALKKVGLRTRPVYGTIKMSNAFYEPEGGSNIDVSQENWMSDKQRAAIQNLLEKYRQEDLSNTEPFNVGGQQFHVQANDLTDEQKDAASQAMRDYTATPEARKVLLEKVAKMMSNYQFGDAGNTLADSEALPPMDLSVPPAENVASQFTDADKERYRRLLEAQRQKQGMASQW